MIAPYVLVPAGVAVLQVIIALPEGASKEAPGLRLDTTACKSWVTPCPYANF